MLYGWLDEHGCGCRASDTSELGVEEASLLCDNCVHVMSAWMWVAFFTAFNAGNNQAVVKVQYNNIVAN